MWKTLVTRVYPLCANLERIGQRGQINTFTYEIPKEQVYKIDIKNFRASNTTTDLTACEKDGSLLDLPKNPFNLTNPRVRGDKNSRGAITNYLAFGVRMYGFILDETDPPLQLNLQNDTNKIVLSMRFVYASARGSVNFMLNELKRTCL